MAASSFATRRDRIETYFDRTASDAWARLTSTEKVGGIRATVRAGRDRMRATIRAYLPHTLDGLRVLDAGSGTGALACELALSGADVTGVELSTTLAALARTRAPHLPGPGKLRFVVGDMTDPAFGTFNHVVAMDSLIHYRVADVIGVLSTLAARTDRSIVFTFAPRTPLLSVMHALGKLFPRGNRSPAIEPVAEATLRRRIAAAPGLHGWTIGRTARIAGGFYISQAMELVRA